MQYLYNTHALYCTHMHTIRIAKYKQQQQHRSSTAPHSTLDILTDTHTHTCIRAHKRTHTHIEHYYSVSICLLLSLLHWYAIAGAFFVQRLLSRCPPFESVEYSSGSCFIHIISIENKVKWSRKLNQMNSVIIVQRSPSIIWNVFI